MTPMFEKLTEIHTSYYNMFIELRDAMPKKIGENKYEYDYGVSYDSIEEVRNDSNYTNAVSNFLKERKETEFIRDSFRYEAIALFQATKNKRERRFIFTVINYFMEDGKAQTALSLVRPYIGVTPEKLIDQKIDYIIEEGSSHYYETPSIRLAASVNRSNDPRNFVDWYLEEMTTNFFLASDQFIKLKYAIKAGQL
jgi:hypothetical protein